MFTRRTFNTTVIISLSGWACGRDVATAADPDLRNIIEREIRANVRESWGELNGENFSSADLEQFHHDGIPAKITQKLRTDPEFLRAVQKVGGMDRDRRAKYLADCRKPLRPTWAELGRVDRSGTTDAGRTAETEIANAIVKLAESLF